MNYQDFKNEVLGKAINIDGAYGAQCWDGVMYYLEKLGYKRVHCYKTGYVKDIYEQKAWNGILNSCEEVKTMKPGDIAVFKEVPNWTPLSHIAIFDHDIDGEYGMFLGQNQGGKNGAFNLVKFPYSATYDNAFRPKCFFEKIENQTDVNDKSVISKNGKFTCLVDAIKIRKAPSIAGEDTGIRYVKNQFVFFDGYVNREGYRWITWISLKNKERRWMAIGELDDKNNVVKYYGRIE